MTELLDWDREGDNRSLYCGFFILDDFSFAGWPISHSLGSGYTMQLDLSKV